MIEIGVNVILFGIVLIIAAVSNAHGSVRARHTLYRGQIVTAADVLKMELWS